MKNSSIARSASFFAAANTSRGFVSMFESIFFAENIGRRYIIKGGPGTGKSSLMRRMALCARERGLDVEYYYCSSDTSSLDGIIIDQRIAIFDGTAPHSYDTRLAGAQDELIDLGAFWNSEALALSIDDIKTQTLIKKAAYENAYGYLASAGALCEVLERSICGCIKRQKMSAAVLRECERLPRAGKRGEGTLKVRQMSALGVRGEAQLDTLSQMAAVRHTLEDYYGTAALFLRELVRCATEMGHNVYVSYDPVSRDRPLEVLLPDTSDYFCIFDGRGENGTEQHINMKRFIDKDALARIRQTYRTATHAYETLKELALCELSRAGEAHASLERIYVANMDFSRLQSFGTELIGRILGEKV